MAFAWVYVKNSGNNIPQIIRGSQVGIEVVSFWPEVVVVPVDLLSDPHAARNVARLTPPIVAIAWRRVIDLGKGMCAPRVNFETECRQLRSGRGE